jgi:hypothetical protein
MRLRGGSSGCHQLLDRFDQILDGGVVCVSSRFSNSSIFPASLRFVASIWRNRRKARTNKHAHLYGALGIQHVAAMIAPCSVKAFRRMSPHAVQVT